MKVKFETTHLYARELSNSDLEHIFKLDSNANVMRYIRKPIESMEQAREALNRYLGLCKPETGLGIWCIHEKSSQQFIGWVMLLELEDSGMIELGYRMLPKFWGKGYSSEISSVVLDYAFKTLKLDKVVGVTQRQNRASQKVLLKQGFKDKGTAYFYQAKVRFFELMADSYLEGRLPS